MASARSLRVGQDGIATGPAAVGGVIRPEGTGERLQLSDFRRADLVRDGGGGRSCGYEAEFGWRERGTHDDLADEPQEGAAFHRIVLRSSGRGGKAVGHCVDKGEAHVAARDAEAIGDADKQVICLDLAALVDVGDLGLVLAGERCDPALRYAGRARQPVHRADVVAGQSNPHLRPFPQAWIDRIVSGQDVHRVPPQRSCDHRIGPSALKPRSDRPSRSAGPIA
jgi:hypothetical protein